MPRDGTLPVPKPGWLAFVYLRTLLNLVNTLSAKADSFFEHPAHWLGYAQLARSRPGTIKNINRSVLIPVDNQSTFVTCVNANTQSFWDGGTARRAFLTGSVRGYLDYLTTSSFSLVRQYCDEARPGYVGNRSGKPAVPDHPSDIQAFHSELAVARNQIIRNFMSVLLAKVCHARVQPTKSVFGFPTILSTLLFARNASAEHGATREVRLSRIAGFQSFHRPKW
jgi:hypothetical protein